MRIVARGDGELGLLGILLRRDATLQRSPLLGQEYLLGSLELLKGPEKRSGLEMATVSGHPYQSKFQVTRTRTRIRVGK